MKLKEFNYEHLEVGEDLGTRIFEITDHMIKEYARAIESQHDWYFRDSPFGGRIAPPTLLDNECLRMLDLRYARFGSIHAKQSWRFLKPQLVGTRVHVNVRIVDKFIKRGKGYFVMELTAKDDSGDIVCAGKHTSVVSLVKHQASRE